MKKIFSVYGLILVLFIAALSFAEEKGQPIEVPRGPATNEKIQIPKASSLGNGLYRIGSIMVNTAKKEISVPGVWKMNEGVIEYIAAVKGGFKLYETVLELDVNAYEFNLALILIGLDQTKGKAAAMHFDPNAPEGDPVEVWVEWEAGKEKKVYRAEDLVINEQRDMTMPHTHWVYTGSTVLEDGSYMAQMDGVLIGFVHDPSVIIDAPSGFGLSQYGTLVVNKKIAPPVGTNITLTVKSLKKAK